MKEFQQPNCMLNVKRLRKSSDDIILLKFVGTAHILFRVRLICHSMLTFFLKD